VSAWVRALLVGVVIAVAGCALPGVAAASNDNFADATVISASATSGVITVV
jgi:hypothetical protein